MLYIRVPGLGIQAVSYGEHAKININFIISFQWIKSTQFKLVFNNFRKSNQALRLRDNPKVAVDWPYQR